MIKLNISYIKTKSGQSHGFTLIELLISISILSLLLFTGAYSYSLMSERWNKELGQFSQSAKQAKNLEHLQRLLEGVQPFVVVDANKKPSLFFIGDNNSLLAVSRAGLFDTEYPVIFRLSTLTKANEKVDLVYQSSSTEQVLLIGTTQNINFTKQITLFTDLDQVNFSYFGWTHLYEKTAVEKNNKNHHWFEQFSGIDNQLMPEKFAINLTKDGRNLSFSILLETNPERWLSPYFKENQ